MAGLDIPSRKEVSDLLGKLNEAGDMRIALVLRAKGEGTMPDWITDVCEVRDGEVSVGTKEEWQSRKGSNPSTKIEEIDKLEAVDNENKEALIRLSEVSVSYGDGTRPVLKKVSWSIKPGDRWHLQGANGE